MNQVQSTASPRLAADRFASHVLGTRYEDLPEDAIARAKTFILDTFGVGISGSSASGAAELFEASSSWGTGPQATIWGRREKVPATTAAFLNAFQIHCQEYDCVHEGAVLHPMATLLPAVMAYAERNGGVSGRDLITAVAVGVDVSVSLGVATKSGLRFFRPGSSGGFGAAAAVARLMGFSHEQLLDTFGVQYAQSSGTMQSHIEASPVLPMQVGFNSRAALAACDIAAAGVTGPHDVFEGPYGYMRLFEAEWDLEPVLQSLGTIWRISEVSHKPYPAGRAAHGGVEGIMILRERYPFKPEDIEELTVSGPPLLARLCARPDVPEPKQNYARLCMAFGAAKVLQHGFLDLAHFRGAELTDPLTHELAKRVRTVSDGSTDPNTLMPQTVSVRLKNGEEHSWVCEALLASPTRRLTLEQHLTKFRRCWQFAHHELSTKAGEQLIATIDSLEDMTDVRDITPLLAP